MGDKTLIYKQKVLANLDGSYKHLSRLNSAFLELEKKYAFPVQKNDFEEIINNIQTLAYSDQCIYRFSKLQDCLGAKLFKSVLLYQGENVNKPFLDLLNQLESIDILDVDEWFEIRDLRNEIAHDYDSDDTTVLNVLNTIHKLKDELENILNAINALAVR